jgi:hypothetical protein
MKNSNLSFVEAKSFVQGIKDISPLSIRNIGAAYCTIDVEVAPTQRVSNFFSRHWTWIWTAIFIPVGGYVWKKYREKRKVDEFNQITNHE